MTAKPTGQSRYATPARLLRPANDNQAHSPSREQMRIGIMLDWWQCELARLMRNRSGGAKWLAELREAQQRVLQFASRMAGAA